MGSYAQPIFDLIKKTVPVAVKTIHLQIDGPTTQYRNKTNFYLFQYHCEKLELDNATYNFTTSGHGKSEADGSGGSAKSLCNRAVLRGKDVISKEDVVSVISGADSKLKIFPISIL